MFTRLLQVVDNNFCRLAYNAGGDYGTLWDQRQTGAGFRDKSRAMLVFHQKFINL